MTISEVIADLEQVRDVFGDLDVIVDGSGRPPTVSVEQAAEGDSQRFFKVAQIRVDYGAVR